MGMAKLDTKVIFCKETKCLEGHVHYVIYPGATLYFSGSLNQDESLCLSQEKLKEMIQEDWDKTGRPDLHEFQTLNFARFFAMSMTPEDDKKVDAEDVKVKDEEEEETKDDSKDNEEKDKKAVKEKDAKAKKNEGKEEYLEKEDEEDCDDEEEEDCDDDEEEDEEDCEDDVKEDKKAEEEKAKDAEAEKAKMDEAGKTKKEGEAESLEGDATAGAGMVSANPILLACVFIATLAMI
jgi:hypothetical protein